MGSVFIEGSVIRHYTLKPFTDFAGNPVTPDQVTFSYSVQNQPAISYTWTNPTGDPDGVIQNTGTGTFYADVDSTGYPGIWACEWSCKPSSGIDTSATQTVAEWEITVSAPTIG